MIMIEKPTCKTCGFYENNCPFIRGKFIPYPNKVCKDYTFSTLKADALIAGAKWAKEQEQMLLPEDTLIFKKGVEEGRRLMMEDAVEGEVVKDISNRLCVTAKNINLDGFRFGDKVRIIILPKED